MRYAIVHKRPLDRYGALIRVRYDRDKYAEAGEAYGGATSTEWVECQAISIEDAREQLLRLMRCRWPRAGLVVKSVTKLRTKEGQYELEHDSKNEQRA